MSGAQVNKYVVEVRALMEARLRVRGRSLEHQLNRAGRFFPIACRPCVRHRRGKEGYDKCAAGASGGVMGVHLSTRFRVAVTITITITAPTPHVSTLSVNPNAVFAFAHAFI